MNSTKKRILPKKQIPLSRRISVIAPGLVLILALGWLGFDLDPDQRMVLFRYLAMSFAGCMAFITPHLLYPDSEKTLIQQLNLTPRQLFLHHLLKLRPLFIFALVALVFVAFADLHHPTGYIAEKLRIFATGTLAMGGTMLYALYRFVTIGSLSQKWNEGKVGKKTFDSLKKMGKSSPVAAGMYPTFISTILVTFFGMMAVVISAMIPHIFIAVVPFVLLAGYSGYRLYREIPGYDRLFYQSDAFYNELFTNPTTGSGESRAPASYEAVYWVPHRWRAAVWSQLIQLDRKRPMGRIIALFSFLYWFLIYIDTPETWFSGWLVFWILSKNMLAWPVSDSRISPPVFHRWMMPARDWVIARFFLQIRWTLAFFVTVGAAALFSGSVSWTEVWLWTGFDIVISAISAWMLTRNNEYTFQNRYV